MSRADARDRLLEAALIELSRVRRRDAFGVGYHGADEKRINTRLVQSIIASSTRSAREKTICFAAWRVLVERSDAGHTATKTLDVLRLLWEREQATARQAIAAIEVLLEEGAVFAKRFRGDSFLVMAPVEEQEEAIVDFLQGRMIWESTTR